MLFDIKESVRGHSGQRVYECNGAVSYIWMVYDKPTAPCHNQVRGHSGQLSTNPYAWNKNAHVVRVGLGRIIALYHRSSTSPQIR